MPRVLNYIFGEIALAQAQNKVSVLVRCRYIEIYNKALYDLLDEDMPKLKIREDLKRGIYIERASEERVASAK